MANHFTSDIRPETYPLCGFHGNWNGEEGKLYRTRVVTDEASPDGKPFQRTEYIAGATIDHPDMQYYIGFGNNGIGTPPVQGMELFARWIFRARNHYPGGGEQTIFASSSKFVLIGDAGANHGISRINSQFRDNGMVAESSAVELMVNINGGPRHEVADQEWHAYQIAVKSSSQEDRSDGRLRLWADDMVEASPHIDTRDVRISVVDWGGSLKYGGFIGFEGAPPQVWNPPPILDMGTFQLGDTFDPNWGKGGSTPPIPPIPEVPSIIPINPATPFVMKQNAVYKLPGLKCMLFTAMTSAVIEQSNNPLFTNHVLVQRTNGQAVVAGTFIRCTSGNIVVTMKTD